MKKIFSLILAYLIVFLLVCLTPLLAQVSSVQSINAHCYGIADGKIILTVIPGTIISNLNVNGPSPGTLMANNTQIWDLLAGSYNLTVSIIGHSNFSTTINVNQPPLLTSSFISSDISCFGYNNGTIDMTVLGGSSPYQFSWSNGATTEDLANLSIGIYSVFVVDSNGCVADDPNAVAPTINWNYSVTANSHLIMIPTGGITVDGYPINIGDFVGVFYDSLGTPACGGYITWQGNMEVLSAWGTTTGQTNGFSNMEEFTWLIATGGTVVEAEAIYSNSFMFTDMGNWVVDGLSGLVSLIATSNTSNGDSISIEILEPAQLFSNSTISDFNGYNISCNGSSDGSIVLQTNGGVAPYSYIWDTGGSNSYLNSLTEGNYSVVVTDANNCQSSNNFVLTEPDTISISKTITDVTCFGFNNGSISLSVSGGVSPFSYLWSNGETTNTISDLYADVYEFFITDANNCIIIRSAIVEQSNELIITVSVQPSGIGMTNGSAIIDVSGGIPPYSYFWSNGNTNTSSNTLGAGTYYVMVTDSQNCNMWGNFEILDDPALIVYGCLDPLAINYNPLANTSDSSCVYIDNPPTWISITTVNSHLIQLPVASQIIVDSLNIEPGDYIGVFYDSLGTLACGGYTMWTNNNTNLIAWGDDLLSSNPDGFQTGEIFKWKMWDASNSMEYTAMANYDSTFTNEDMFVTNGTSGLLAITANNTGMQEIALPLYWSIFSTYINPIDANIANVLSDIVNHVEIVKDSYGNIYWPQYYVNMINDLTIGKAYQIKMLSPQVLTVTGLAVSPELTEIVLPAFWSMLGYLRQAPAAINLMLYPIVGNIIIVKSGNGSIYWPQYYVNNIGNMMPGQGYQINMLTTDTLTYPAN